MSIAISCGWAALGYPAEMRECSRYFVPRADRTIPVGRRTDSPLAAMHRLARKIGVELGVPPNELPQPYGQP